MKKLLSMNSNTAVSIVQILCYLHGAIWLVLATITAVRGLSEWDETPAGMLVSALLMLGNAAVFAWVGFKISERRIGVYLLALAILFINLFLTVTDQLGTIDIIVLLISLSTLILLMIKRKSILPNTTTDGHDGAETSDRLEDT